MLQTLQRNINIFHVDRTSARCNNQKGLHSLTEHVNLFHKNLIPSSI